MSRPHSSDGSTALEAFPVLDIDEPARRLAAGIVAGHRHNTGRVPGGRIHIAVAAVHGIDVLVTWNFTHLNNPFTRMMIQQLVENAGYRCPEICSPL